MRRLVCSWLLAILTLGAPQALSGLGMATESPSTALPREAEGAVEDEKVVQLIEDGEKALDRGRHKAAIRSFKRADKRAKSNSVEALIGLTKTYRRLADYESSADYARTAVQRARDPVTQLQAYNLLGLALLEGSLQADSESWSNESDVASRKAALEEAEAVFQKVLEVSDGQANGARYNLAEVLTEMRRHEEAVSLVEDYLEREPRGTLAPSAVGLREHLRCVEKLDPLGLEESEDGIESPVKLRSRAPELSEGDRRRRTEGVVIVRAVIDEHGSVVCPRVLKGASLGLTEATLNSLRHWKYRPATRNGQPVAVVFNLTMNISFR